MMVNSIYFEISNLNGTVVTEKNKVAKYASIWRFLALFSKLFNIKTLYVSSHNT